MNLAACKIAGVLFGLERWQTLLGGRPAERRLRRALRAVGRARHRHDPVLHQDVGGDRGGLLRGERRRRSAGSTGSIDKLSATRGPGRHRTTSDILPDFTNNWDLAVAVFIMPIAVQWWAVWYPGAEPGGGSYVAQRMLASKSERDALGAVLFFNVAHYVLRPWPWILVALASIIVYPELSDIQRALAARRSAPDRARHRVSGDAEVPAGRVHRPDGRRPHRGELLDDPHAPELGRVVPGPRFLPPVRQAATPASGTTCCAGRVVTVLLFLASSAMVYLLDTAQGRFDIILQVGAGTGPALPGALVLVARERVVRNRRDDQLVCDLGRAPRPGARRRQHQHARRAAHHRGGHDGLLAARRLPGARDGSRRAEGVLPQGPPLRPGLGGDSRGSRAARSRAKTRENIPLALLGWVAGSMAIWSSLFAVGNYLYGRTGYAIGLTIVFVITGRS